MAQALQLVIGNRNYSSWSLRAWLAMRRSGLSFEEVFIPLDVPESKSLLAKHSPSGLVPVLKVDGTDVWDSLAIIETLNDMAPGAQLWPEDATARAVARAVSAEMHAGFFRLRRDMPMDLRSEYTSVVPGADVNKDIARIVQLWSDCRGRFGEAGPFLFGTWSAADMMYAPVVGRLRTYGVPVNEETLAYMDAVWSQPDMAEWVQAAREEPYFIDVLQDA